MPLLISASSPKEDWKKFQDHVTAELKIFGFVDNPHAPTADLAQYAVMGERLPERLEGGGPWRRW